MNGGEVIINFPRSPSPSPPPSSSPSPSTGASWLEGGVGGGKWGRGGVVAVIGLVSLVVFLGLALCLVVGWGRGKGGEGEEWWMRLVEVRELEGERGGEEGMGGMDEGGGEEEENEMGKIVVGVYGKGEGGGERLKKALSSKILSSLSSSLSHRSSHPSLFSRGRRAEPSSSSLPSSSLSPPLSSASPTSPISSSPSLTPLSSSDLPTPSSTSLTILPFPSNNSSTCQNTRQGSLWITDEYGYICKRDEMDKQRRGCCPETARRFSCRYCREKEGCCRSFEDCVSCCVSPSQIETLKQRMHIKQAKQTTLIDVKKRFELCTAFCRTSSLVIRGNIYTRPHLKYCYANYSSG